jgi:hypothetical protein
MFSSGKNAAQVFGSNLYLVTTDVFELITAPSTVIGEKVDPADLGVGDIVIFETEGGYKSIGRITERGFEELGTETESENETEELVMFFKISDETGTPNIISERAIVAKATKSSRTLGTIANFAKSPAGVLTIAVIPCVSIILWELMKPLFRKRMDKKQVVPVNKQEEIPTFISPDAIPEPKEAVQKIVPAEKPERPEKTVNPNPAAALKAYKQTLTHTLALDEAVKQPELFVSPAQEKPPIQSVKVSSPSAAETAENSSKKKPLSSVKLAEVIASVNAQKTQEKANLKLKENKHDKL